MPYDEPLLTLGLDANAIAGLWGLAALVAATSIACVAARAILTRRAAPATDAVRRRPVARCAVTTGLALTLAAFASWLLLSAPLAARADTVANGSDTGLGCHAIATKHAVAEAFPQIQQIFGLRPDPLHAHDQGLALDILIPGDPTSGAGIALGDGIRDFLVTRADEFGIDHVLWREHMYGADGASAPMRPRGSDVANHVTHLHVTTKGCGYL
jgi:hypothetical protein